MVFLAPKLTTRRLSSCCIAFSGNIYPFPLVSVFFFFCCFFFLFFFFVLIVFLPFSRKTARCRAMEPKTTNQSTFFSKQCPERSKTIYLHRLISQLCSYNVSFRERILFLVELIHFQEEQVCHFDLLSFVVQVSSKSLRKGFDSVGANSFFQE